MPTPTKYTYSISTDFPNAIVATNRLSKEIQESAIVTALDYINTSGDDCDVWFKDVLSPGDETTLDGLVAAHTGEPLPSEVMPVSLETSTGDNLQTTACKKLIVSIWPTVGTRSVLITHNWCDKTTWYTAAVRVVDEVTTDSGNHLTYELANAYVIDTYHGKLSGEDFLVDGGSNSYRAVVKVNTVTKTERDPHLGSGGDYTINYAAGTVTFFSALDPADEVTVTYHYATTSVFTVKPLPGKKLSIKSTEVQFSIDVELADTVVFQPYGLVEIFAPQYCPNPYPEGTLIPLGAPLRYKTFADYFNEANGMLPQIPALGGAGWRSLNQPVVTLPWSYIASTELYASKGMEIRISLAHDAPFIGTYATATLYCLSEAGS